MAENEITVSRTPEQVFAVLADPYCYEHWVVGSSETRDVEGAWPAVGATFHHTQFLPKVGIKDTTTVLECEPPSRILLCVRARPMVVAKVEVQLRAIAEETSVTMFERPVGGVIAPIYNPVFDLALRLRNTESLRRLKRLAESRSV